MKENLQGKREYFQLQKPADGKLDLTAVFGNTNPVQLEIGSGRGEFLLARASAEPQTNFLGIDVKDKRIKSILRLLQEGVHDNVRVLRLLVDESFSAVFGKQVFERIYIIHPDPWPKRKHHKKRLIQPAFIELLFHLLQPNGIVRIATDHAGYAEWIRTAFREYPGFASLYPEGYSIIPPSDHFPTFFEIKQKKLGFDCYYFSLQRRDHDQ